MLGLLFWDHHPIWSSSVDLFPHRMEVGDRTAKYCRCLLFVFDQTSGQTETTFPFSNSLLMFTFKLPSQALFTCASFQIIITGASVYCK